MNWVSDPINTNAALGSIWNSMIPITSSAAEADIPYVVDRFAVIVAVPLPNPVARPNVEEMLAMAVSDDLQGTGQEEEDERFT